MTKYQDDIVHIRRMMEKSSTFLSLSGWSGISAGIIAFIGSGLTFRFLSKYQVDYFDAKPIFISPEFFKILILIAALTLIFALLAAYFFTSRKSKRLGLKLWSVPTKNLLKALFIPLIAGGIFCIILISHGLFYMVAPSMLIFYGLALINASHYTNDEIHWLGILELILGLISALFTGYGLIFWTIGFGLLHIIYGIVMEIKYK